jgi:hypothetical protein
VKSLVADAAQACSARSTLVRPGVEVVGEEADAATVLAAGLDEWLDFEELEEKTSAAINVPIATNIVARTAVPTMRSRRF